MAAAASGARADRLVTFGEIFPVGQEPDGEAYRFQRNLSADSQRLGGQFLNEIKQIRGGDAGFDDQVQKTCNFWAIPRQTFQAMPLNRKLLNMMYCQVETVAKMSGAWGRHIYTHADGGIYPGTLRGFGKVACPLNAELFRDPPNAEVIQRVRELIRQPEAPIAIAPGPVAQIAEDPLADPLPALNGRQGIHLCTML